MVGAHGYYHGLMGNPLVMVAKVIWDTIIYWAIPGLLFFHDKVRGLAESPLAFQNLYRCWTVHHRVQAFFREWHEIDNPPAADTFADPYSRLDFLMDLHNGMAAGLSDEEFDQQFLRNVRLLEQVAGQLAATVMERLAPRSDEELVFTQIEQWANDPLLKELIGVYREDGDANPIDSCWITLGCQKDG